MATDLFSNLSSTTVSAGGTTAPAALTVETWTVTSSTGFPAATVAGGTQFRVVEDDVNRQTEICLVTAVSGTTWTVTRGAEGTTPVAHPAGFTVVQTVTTAGLGNAYAMFIKHGANASFTRPAYAGVVIWVGTVQPTNWLSGDLFVNNA